MTTKIFSVPTLSCHGCATKIEALSSQLKGVDSIRASPEEKCLTITFEDGSLDLKELDEEITDLGHQLGSEILA